VKAKTRKKRRAYPPKHRAHLAQKARENKPWRASTGPKTETGKATSAQNATKSGLYSTEINALRVLLRRHAKILSDLRNTHV
jgi:hypothetical protein